MFCSFFKLQNKYDCFIILTVSRNCMSVVACRREEGSYNFLLCKTKMVDEAIPKGMG